MRSIVPWVGGKGSVVKQLIEHLPQYNGRYIEPFLGGATMLLNIQPKVAIVNDKNPWVSLLFSCVKNYPKVFCAVLAELPEVASAAEYNRRLAGFNELIHETTLCKDIILRTSCRCCVILLPFET